MCARDSQETFATACQIGHTVLRSTTAPTDALSSHQRSRKRVPEPDRRRAFELLVASRDGRAEAIMLAHGFTVELLVELIRAGLATATAERLVAGERAMEVARVRITEAGRQVLADKL